MFVNKFLAKYLIENHEFHLVQWQRSDGTTFYTEADIWLVRQHWGETDVIRLCYLANTDKDELERIKGSLQGYLQHIGMASSAKTKVKLLLTVPCQLGTDWVKQFRQELIELEQRNVLLSVDFIGESDQIDIDKGRRLNFGLSTEKLQELLHTVSLLSSVEREALTNISLTAVQPIEQEDIGFSKDYPWVTNGLVLVLGLVFLVSAYVTQGLVNLSVDGLISMGAKYGPAIVMGEYWRLFTAAFLHGGLIHFGLNIFALYNLGAAVERIYGHLRFLVIYLIAAVAGNVLSFYFLPDTVSVGASGAIFGLFGALLALKWKSPRFFAKTIGSGVLSSIVINLVYGIITPGIDNYAHIGGLIGGLIIALPLTLGKDRHRIVRNEVIAVMVCVFVLGGGAWLGWRQESASPLYFAEQGQKLLQAGEFEQAADYFSKARQTEPSNLRYTILLGWAVLEQGEYDKAITLFDQVLKRDSTNAAAHYFKAHAFLRKGLIQPAYIEAQEAVKLAPEYNEAKTLVEQIEAQYRKE